MMKLGGQTIQGDRVPSIKDTGKEMRLSLEEISKINDMLEYANAFYTPEFDQKSLSDSILANVGLALTGELQETVDLDDYKLGIKKEVFDDAIYNYFGKGIKEPEKLDTGIISFEKDYYIILPIGFGEEGVYFHKFVKAYDLGDGYIKIACSVDYTMYDSRIADYVLTEDAGVADLILKINKESSFGYNVIAYRVDIRM